MNWAQIVFPVWLQTGYLTSLNLVYKTRKQEHLLRVVWKLNEVRDVKCLVNGLLWALTISYFIIILLLLLQKVQTERWEEGKGGASRNRKSTDGRQDGNNYGEGREKWNSELYVHVGCGSDDVGGLRERLHERDLGEGALGSSRSHANRLYGLRQVTGSLPLPQLSKCKM